MRDEGQTSSALTRQGFFTPADGHSIEQHRKKVAALPTSHRPPANIKRQDFYLRVDGNTRLHIKLHYPEDFDLKGGAKYACCFYYPGTAFVAKEDAVTNAICAILAVGMNGVIIEVNTRLAPENECPIGAQDAFNAYKWLVSNLPFIDKNKVGLIGYSSGGNYAALLALQAVTEGIPLNRVYLISAILDLSMNFIDEENYHDKAMPLTFLKWFLDLYLGDTQKAADPSISPIWAEIDKKHRPVLAFCGERDATVAQHRFYVRKVEAAAHNGSMLTLFPDADHGLLWTNQGAVEQIAKIMAVTLDNYKIPRKIREGDTDEAPASQPRPSLLRSCL